MLNAINYFKSKKFVDFLWLLWAHFVTKVSIGHPNTVAVNSASDVRLSYMRCRLRQSDSCERGLRVQSDINERPTKRRGRSTSKEMTLPKKTVVSFPQLHCKQVTS